MHDPLIGRRLGPYEIQALLSRGGMAPVYRAFDHSLQRQVALKVLHAPGPEQRDLSERFLREARTLASQSHPAIVPIFSVGQQDELSYFAQELLPGPTLADELAALQARGARLEPARVQAIVAQLANALDYAHSRGIIHRDLKPANVMRNAHGALVLLDFGIAQSTVHFDRLTRTGVVLGTPTYWAPEQAMGNAALTPAVDIYALGVVLFELLTGRVPFDDPSPLAVALAHVSQPPPSVRALRPELPAAVEQVVLRALAKSADERYSSAGALAQALAAGWAPTTRPLQPTASAPAAPTRRRSNLPHPLTRCIGREQELSAVCTLLQRDAVRLVTLTGVGGIGKTRLALEVAAWLLDDFEHHVFFVDLAAIRDPQLVPSALAQVLGVQETGHHALLQTLQNELRERRLLLLLDNFEHIVAAAPILVALLARAPRLKVLVTSRVVLKVRGEQEVPVPPLSRPGAQGSADPAVALFAERARAARADFALTSTSAPVIAEICRRLDGLPLAIELAAARIRVLSPELLLQRLGQRLRLLTGGARDLPQRHQTLRAAIAWSYELLQPEEQRLFRWLGMCVGGCSLEAAEALCQRMGDTAADVLDGLAALQEQSLLRQDQVAGEPRFWMLETLRDYALEQLGACGELHVTRQHHAEYYLALAQQSAMASHGPQQSAWLERMECEHDNLRAALTWALAEGHTEVALDLAGSLLHFWLRHAHLSEGRRWCARVLALAGAASSTVRGGALRCAGVLAWAQGAYAVAQGYLEESLTQYRAAGDDRGVALVLMSMGMVARPEGALSRARSLFEESLRHFQELEDMRGVALVTYHLGLLCFIVGDTATAQQLYEDVLLVGRRMQSYHDICLGLNGLADVAICHEEYLRAQKLLEESMHIARFATERYHTLEHSEQLGWIYFEQDAYAQAQQLWEEGLRFARERGSQHVARFLNALGLLSVVRQDYAHARACYSESLSGPRDVGTVAFPACLQRIAALLLAGGDGRAAEGVALLSAADAWCARTGIRCLPQDQRRAAHAVERGRVQLADHVFDHAWATGRAMSLDEAIANALEWLKERD